MYDYDVYVIEEDTGRVTDSVENHLFARSHDEALVDLAKRRAYYLEPGLRFHLVEHWRNYRLAKTHHRPRPITEIDRGTRRYLTRCTCGFSSPRRSDKKAAASDGRTHIAKMKVRDRANMIERVFRDDGNYPRTMKVDEIESIFSPAPGGWAILSRDEIDEALVYLLAKKAIRRVDKDTYEPIYDNAEYGDFQERAQEYFNKNWKSD